MAAPETPSLFPGSLLKDDDSFCLPPVDLNAVLTFTDRIGSFDLISIIEDVVKGLPTGDVKEMESAVFDVRIS